MEDSQTENKKEESLDVEGPASPPDEGGLAMEMTARQLFACYADIPWDLAHQTCRACLEGEDKNKPISFGDIMRTRAQMAFAQADIFITYIKSGK